MGGGDCGYGFQVGESYLVDADRYGPSGGLSTSICAGTQLASRAVALLREVRTGLTSGRLPDLTGTVWESDALQGGNADTKPLPGITVQVTPVNGNAYRATTDEQGIYSFASLPPGVYGIEFDLPPHRVSYEVANKRPQTVTIPSGDGVGAACHRDTTALPAGTISGQVVDNKGKGLNTLGVVNLHKPGNSTPLPSAAFLDRDGRFTLQFVPEGEYVVAFERWSPLRESPMQADEMHPNGTATVKDGQSVDGIRIVVQ